MPPLNIGPPDYLGDGKSLLRLRLAVVGQYADQHTRDRAFGFQTVGQKGGRHHTARQRPIRHGNERQVILILETTIDAAIPTRIPTTPPPPVNRSDSERN